MIIIELEWLDMGNYHLSWFKSYLTSKKQFVNIYDIFPIYPIYHRMSSNVFTQVPSYSILFINFIVKYLYYTTFLLFTDDIKIYPKIDSTPNCNFFQFELNMFWERIHRINRTLNFNKCQYTMSFFGAYHTFLLLNGTLLERVFGIKGPRLYYTLSLSFA